MLGSAQPCLAPNPILGTGNLCGARACLPKPQPNISCVVVAEEKHLPPPPGWLQWVPGAGGVHLSMPAVCVGRRLCRTGPSRARSAGAAWALLHAARLAVRLSGPAWAWLSAARLAVALSGSLRNRAVPTVQSSLPALQRALPGHATTFQGAGEDVAIASSQDIRGPSWQPSLKCCVLLIQVYQIESHLFPNV